ncbi:murein hydrolase activator EnvC family protein [Peribacillus kribbensis]|uniref:murein hydrolase activator EnvC family protein n=1 Tax=Peribacillus kribbensis TaxID=356658 RepID=UPI0003FFD962|nr:peptidoglycan DD-metalloendopeptidase family protein [Peribacillus kribbensis]
MLKKKNLILNISLVAGLGLLSSVPPVQAASLNDMEIQKQQIQQKRSTINSGINDSYTKIKDLQGKQQTVAEKIKNLSDLITKTTSQINDKTKEIDETKAEIEKLKQEIIVIQDRMAKREALLKERARAMQESGGNADYLEVLLGSKSFGDFIERVGAVATIMDADQEILRQQEADKKQLEENQKSVETKLANLQTMLTDLQNMKNKQNQQVAELGELMKQLKQKEDDEHEHAMNLKEQEDLLAAQQQSVQQAINLEKTRQAELAAARQRAAEEARQRAAAEAKERAAAAAAAKAKAAQPHKSQPAQLHKSQAAASTETHSSSSYTPEPRQSAPAVSSGSFTRPAAGYISSGFGARWGENHPGVDIAGSGYVPIVAAADGVVSRSYLSSTYGNVVFISHSINGQVYTTVYAHMSQRLATTGQVVAKGQQIGVMGSTGESTGQHLHFELHRGEWNYAKSNAINPVGIVPL